MFKKLNKLKEILKIKDEKYLYNDLLLLLNKDPKDRRKDIEYFDKNIYMIFCDEWREYYNKNNELCIKTVRNLLLIGYSRLIICEIYNGYFIRTWPGYIYDHLRRICADDLYKVFLTNENRLINMADE